MQEQNNTKERVLLTERLECASTNEGSHVELLHLILVLIAKVSPLLLVLNRVLSIDDA